MTNQQNQTEKCPDSRGNELCTNGKDTYHEYNTKYASGCTFCHKDTQKDKCCNRCPCTHIPYGGICVCRCQKVGYENATSEQKKEMLKEVVKEANQDQRDMMDTSVQESWEIRFNRWFDPDKEDWDNYTLEQVEQTRNEAKDFIRNLIAQEKVKFREMVEGMKIITTKEQRRLMSVVNLDENVGYNSALSDIIEKMK